jgi:hypothetical protein
MFRSLYSRCKSQWSPLDRRLGRLRFDLDAVEKQKVDVLAEN